MSKTTIDIERLRQSKLTSDEVFKDKASLQEEVERKKRKREEAKKEIIRKINEDVTPLNKTKPINRLEPIKKKPKISKKIEDKVKPLTNIKIIKSLNNTENKIKETQERLSYTLQMDVISKDQLASYRERQYKKDGININNKFEKLEPRITKIYLGVVICLLCLVSLSLVLLQTIQS